MARTFSSGYASASLTMPVAYPFTMFVRGNSTSAVARQVAMALQLGSGEGYNGSLLLFDGSVGGDPVRFSKFGGAVADSAGSYSVNTWHAAAGRAYSATALDVSLDGTQTAGPATSVTVKTVVALQIGARATPSIDLAFDGACASVAAWTVALDDAELVSLAKGFSPRRIRPQSLRFYAPLVRELRIPFWSVAAATPSLVDAVGTSTPSDHPRSYGI